MPHSAHGLEKSTFQAIQENPIHAVSAWAFQVHGKARVRTRVVRFDPQAPCQDFFNMLTLILSEADGSKPKKEP